MTLVDLQSGIAELGPRRAGHRFPAELRHALLAHVAQARSQGVAWTTLATQTGIRATSLSRMVAGEQHRTSPMPQPTLVPVVASAPIRDTKGLYLHLPSGAEVRGLDLSTLVTLLQALA
jgi:hypothetical protein